MPRRSFKPRSNRAARLAPLLVAAALLLTGCDRATVDLVSTTSQREANRIVVELAGASIWSELIEERGQRDTGWRVRVLPEAEVAARDILLQRGLPAPAAVGYNAILDDAGLIPSASVERARLMVATAGQITGMLELHDRVIQAGVQVVLPAEDWLGRDDAAARPSASAVIKYRARDGEREVPPYKPDEVRDLIRASVEGMRPDDAVVVKFIASSETPRAFNNLQRPEAPRQPWGIYAGGGAVALAAFGVAAWSVGGNTRKGGARA